MVTLPYPLGQLSSFGIIWTSLSGAYMMKGIYQAMAGAGTDRDFDGEKGIMRFTKRPVRRLFLALGLNGAIYIAVSNCYIRGGSNFGWIQWVMDQAVLPDTPSTDKLSVMVGGGLLLSHTFLRLYQSVYINVFSSHLTQGILDWISPNLYSLLAGFTLISEAPALDGTGTDWFDWSMISWRHGVSIGMFAVLWYNDSKLQNQLAKFRRNRAGHIVSEDHKMPKGGAFDVVSSPQLLTEIMYNVAIGLSLGFGHQAWWACTGYVAISQVVRALGRQQWYRKKFEALPQGRKAIIPYVL